MKLLITVVLATAVAAGTANAVTLWDQSDYDVFGAGFFNSISGTPPLGITQYAVSDVTVDAPGWHVESVSTFYGFIDPSWGTAISEGYLLIYPKTGPLPVDGANDPLVAPLVPMTGTDIGGVWQVTASGLAVDLPPGDYWIGITPIAPGGFFGPEIHMGTVNFVGAETASWDPYAAPGPPAWFNFNPGIDASIKIDGVRPTPVDDTSWSALKALYR
jgi:hypothetical protein